MVLDITEIEYFFIVFELHTVKYLFFIFFFLSPIGTHSSQRNLSSQRKWQAFMAKEKKNEFGLHVKCCSWPSSLTIHEKHLMQALAFLHA